MNPVPASIAGFRVLVTGGTGFTGRHLVRRLCAEGNQVRLIARPSSDRRGFEHCSVQWYLGQVYEESLLVRAIADVDYVFHVAAAYRQAGLADQEYELVHVRSTQILAEAALRNKRLKRFVHVSTVGVLGHIARPPANEESEYNPGDIYQQTKADAEKWLLDFTASTGLPVTVIRPAAIFGPGDDRLLKLFRLARWKYVPIIGFTRGLYHLIHVEDLVSFMVACSRDEAARGRVFICGNEEPTSIREIISSAARRLGHKPTFVRVPAWPVFLLAWLCERAWKALGKEPPLYPRRVAFFTKDRAFDTSRMKKIKGFHYRYDNETGIAAVADFYLSRGVL